MPFLDDRWPRFSPGLVGSTFVFFEAHWYGLGPIKTYQPNDSARSEGGNIPPNSGVIENRLVGVEGDP